MQKCQNCGADLKPGVKFCTKCGTPVAAADMTGTTNQSAPATRSAQPQQTNETIDKLKKHSLNYFAWYKNSITKPSNVNYDNKYFGLVSLLINVLLVAYSFYILGNRVLTTVLDGVSQASSMFGSSNSDQVSVPSGMSLYFKLFLVVLAYFAVFLIVGFVCKKYLLNKNTDFFNYSNQLASFSNSMIILEIIMVLVLLATVPTSVETFSSFSSWGSLKFLVVLLVLMSNIWSVSYIASIVIDKGQMQLDKIYVGVVTLIVNSVVLYFVFKMILNSLQSQYAMSSLKALQGVLG